ncbi:hypothetical protein SAMN05192552_10258 [Natrinema hispanicum]|uniref:Uncharacterized protein n=1 Tax=Natrinema hispanicum TaxID=392421 RepID=A0A1G6V2V8_9EURY|nr:hypothetical protein SAMN05192552_10258 [Natrinema hispanicum]SEU03688.1 hypothetical protein SAMN04488694_1309 [Natrinema hispanicum]
MCYSLTLFLMSKFLRLDLAHHFSRRYWLSQDPQFANHSYETGKKFVHM